ncbi:MAG TPA: PAS domain S-box protein, partial [Gemmatimonadales bacterium]|nr:PAS domain S-box protein [Gemmatimonadales bacterium]
DRLAALRRTALLDTPPEEAFDRLTRMAAGLLGTSVSLISLVADDHQFFKSAIGLPEPWASHRTTPISFSFCGGVVSTGEPLVLEDARRHPLLRHNPVIRELGWVSYAGVPLRTREGQVVGSFCVIDKTPRLWSERDIALLQDLAASVVTEIELRTQITERRNAEQGRRESEEQFHNTFEDSGIGMALISTDGRWLRVNRVLCDMLGCSRDDLVGHSIEARTHPADAPAHREAVRLLMAGECRTYTMETRYVRPTGEILWGLVNVSLVPGPDGEPSHLIAGIQDISERKHVEATLRDSEERYRLLTRATREAVWDWDLITDLVAWDEGSGPPLDYQPGQPGDTAAWWYDRIHPVDRERVVASIDQAIARGDPTWSDEYRFRRADGSYTLVHNRAHIARNETGTPARVIGAISEVSQGRRADPRLAEVLEALPMGVWLVDREGRVVMSNSSSHQLWGAPHRSVESFAEYKAWWPDTGEPVRAEEWGPARAIRGEISVNEEMTIEGFDGTRKTILNSATPIWDPSGEIVGAVNISEDITSKRAEEAGLRQKEEQIRSAQKMEAVGQLAGGIAHDFNNLLTGILSYTDLILQELRPADPIRGDVEQIRDAGRRAATLTRQLLAFSRRQLLQPRVVSLNTTIRDLEPMLARLLGPAIALETELDPGLGNVHIDPARLEQVLVNLALNAKDAMPEGGQVRITTSNIPEESPPSRRQDGPGAGLVRLTVSDTGAGMDVATQTRIFEPFFTTKQASSGTGLGLSTVYGIVEQSGGHISVESAPGQGATFTITLPPYTGSEPAVTTSDWRTPPGGKETLLLVEDEAPIRDSVKRLLEWHGYTVIEARNGVDALTIYENSQTGIDLVLTDLVMPEMGGSELVERIRAHNPEVRVLFMSGYADRPVTDNGSDYDGTGFVEKPFTVETLIRRLREVLDSEVGRSEVRGEKQG